MPMLILQSVTRVILKTRRRLQLESVFIGFVILATVSSASTVGAVEIDTIHYPSIQAAIDANPGREIRLPAGDHAVDKTIRITAQGTSLIGPGRIVMSNPDQHILEIEHARNIRIEGLTFTRPDGRMDTQKEGILVSDTRNVTLERVRIIDNRTRSGSIRFSEVRDGRILNCEIRNYMTIAIDDRTQNVELLGYAFRCIDGTGIVCDRCRGTLIQGTHIVEDNMRPTPEIKAQYQLGQFTKKNPTKGLLISQQVWDAEYVNNWHQGSALIVTGPTYSDMTRIIGNHIENAAQGIDIHSDHVIIANNIVNNAFIGMKAMHGSRNVLVTGNLFSRNDLWAIGLMSGAGASPGVPAKEGQPAVAANVDGGSIIANNIVSQFGYGDSYWMWKEASRAVFRFDNGQEPTDPPLRDVLVTGNLISNPDPDEHPETPDDATDVPRYHYAVRIESGRTNSPRNLQFSNNQFPTGSKGISNIPLAP